MYYPDLCNVRGSIHKLLMIRNKIAIITPVYNDWATFGYLLRDLDATLSHEQFEMSVIAVNDGSTQAFDPKLINANGLHNIKNLQIIHLAANLGHQRAIALGLAYIHDHSSSDLVIVMDCDGEDRPPDIIRLIEKQRHSPETIVFAHRTRR